VTSDHDDDAALVHPQVVGHVVIANLHTAYVSVLRYDVHGVKGNWTDSVGLTTTPVDA
jgi:hypothetical protein